MESGIYGNSHILCEMQRLTHDGIDSNHITARQIGVRPGCHPHCGSSAVTASSVPDPSSAEAVTAVESKEVMGKDG